MQEKFKQKQVSLDSEKGTGKIKIKKLCSLIETHPYKEGIYKVFDIDNIKDDYISIDFIDQVFERVLHFTTKYHRHKIIAETKDIDFYQEEITGSSEANIVFNFEEYVDIDEVRENLKTIAIYDSKNSFLDGWIFRFGLCH